MEDYKKGDVCSCSIDKAENGWIIRYCMKTTPQGAGKYEPIMHKSKEKVFLEKETDEAFDYFKKLKMLESNDKEY